MIHIAVGDKLEKNDGFDLSSGGFTILYPNINHYVWTEKEGAIIQIHGTGPRISMYVDKNEDPTWKHLDVNAVVKAKSLSTRKIFALKAIVKKISFNEGKQYTKWHQQVHFTATNHLTPKKRVTTVANKKINKIFSKKQMTYSRRIKLEKNNMAFSYNYVAEQQIRIISPIKKYLLSSG